MKCSLRVYCVLVVSLAVMTMIVTGGRGWGIDVVTGEAPADKNRAKVALQTQAELWRLTRKEFKISDIEPLAKNSSAEIYCFFFHPFFDKPLLLTAYLKDGKPACAVERFSKKAVLELQGEFEIDAKAFEALQKNFSNPRVRDPLSPLTLDQWEDVWDNIYDGSNWHLEIVKGGVYNYVMIHGLGEIWAGQKEKNEIDRNLPDLTPFAEACIEMVKVAGLPLIVRNFDPLARRTP